jgi:hypothetical protein
VVVQTQLLMLMQQQQLLPSSDPMSTLAASSLMSAATPAGVIRVGVLTMGTLCLTLSTSPDKAFEAYREKPNLA